MSKLTLPSLSGLGNIVLLLIINLVLTLAFLDQFINHDLPCPLCILQRMGFTLIGLMFLLNIRSGAQPAHYGFAILFTILGLSVSLRQVLLHVIIPDRGTRSRHWFAQFVCIWFILLLIGNLLSTLSICGLGACADNPLRYEGIEQVRQWLTK